MILRGYASANDLAVYYLLLKSPLALPHDSADEVFSEVRSPCPPVQAALSIAGCT